MIRRLLAWYRRWLDRRWRGQILALADGHDSAYWAVAAQAFRRKGDSYRQSLGRSHPLTRDAYAAAAKSAAIMAALRSEAPR